MLQNLVFDTFTAIPLASVPKEAADGQVFGTHCVLVSEMWIKEVGIFSSRLATCEKTAEISLKHYEMATDTCKKAGSATCWTLVCNPWPISVPPWLTSTVPSL